MFLAGYAKIIFLGFRGWYFGGTVSARGARARADVLVRVAVGILFEWKVLAGYY